MRVLTAAVFAGQFKIRHQWLAAFGLVGSFALSPVCFAQDSVAATEVGVEAVESETVQAEAQLSPAAVAFERIKALEGTWIGKATWDGSEEEPGEESPDIMIVYALTGAGSAVVETQFPGEPHEMTTVYHLDGDRLLATHYCAAGNQPRMVATPAEGDDPDRVIFDFLDVTNLDGPDAMHIHDAAYQFVGPDEIITEWRAMAGGETQGHARFFLNRQASE